MISILHLSDIHFGRNEKKVPMHRWKKGPHTRDLRTAIFTDFQKNLKCKADYLVISGDLTYQGDEAEFKDVLEFLNGICKDLIIKDKKRVIICPGNHDVNWKVGKQYPERRFDPYLQFLREFYEDSLFRELYPNVKWDFDISSERPSADHIVGYYKFPDVEFLSLNSCVYEDKQDHYGFIGSDQIDSANTLLKERKKYARIAVFHHHLLPFPDIDIEPSPKPGSAFDLSIIRDGGRIQILLQELEFDIALHGHKHVPLIRHGTLHYPIDSAEDKAPLMVLGAGSAGVDKDKLDYGIENHYYFLRVDNDRGRTQIQVQSRIAKEFQWKEHSARKFELPNIGGSKKLAIVDDFKEVEKYFKQEIHRSKEIDILVMRAASLFDSHAQYLTAFCKDSERKLRICLIDPRDEVLHAVYMRKFETATSIQVLQAAYRKSLSAIASAHPCLKINDDFSLSSVPKVNASKHALLQIFYLKIPVSYSYYRFDEHIYLIPLGMARRKDPHPVTFYHEKGNEDPAIRWFLDDFTSLLSDLGNPAFSENLGNLAFSSR